ncbi:MAG: tetratricopeptide repeat protein [Dinghuibacter sp.]|nr:tetratricopeptide repeat protein [Dinghuibacter sp.]
MLNRNTRIIFFSLLVFAVGFPVFGQKGNGTVLKGNEWYRAAEYEKAEAEYGKALEQDKNNYRAAYNKGNALYRQKKFTAAAEAYTVSSGIATSEQQSFQSLYNKGTALARNNDLPGAITALKQALKLNPNDEDCRFNLARAQYELKQQQHSSNNNAQQQQPQRPQNQPPQRKSKLNNEQLKQVLLAIRKKEKEVQNRLKNSQSPGIVQPDKDW